MPLRRPGRTGRHGGREVSSEASRSDRSGWYRQAPNATSVVVVMEAAGGLMVAGPLYVAVVLSGPHAVRSWPALVVATVLVTVGLTAALGEIRRFRRGDFDGFRPVATLAELSAFLGAAAAFGVAFGLDHGILVLLTCVPFLAAPIAGGVRMIGWSWAALVVALAVETGLQLPAGEAARFTVAAAGTMGIVAVTLHRIFGASLVSNQVNMALANLAAATGNLRSWPDGLRLVAPQLAAVMSVDRYAVLAKGAVDVADEAGGAAEEVFCWPQEGWGDPRARQALAVRAVADQAVVPGQGCWAVPSTVGKRFGVVVVVPSRAADGNPTDTARAVTVAALLGSMCERSHLMDGLADLAFTDELTDLGNQRRLHDALRSAVAGAERTGRSVSLAVLELDGFREHVDLWGRASGDEVLKQFARWLERTVAPIDLAVRLDGAQFCVLLAGCGPAEAATVVESVRSGWTRQQGAAGCGPLSSGIATWPEVDELPEWWRAARPAADDEHAAAEDVMRRAELALQAGRRAAEPTATWTGPSTTTAAEA